MKVRIEIDTSTFVRFWLVVIGFAFAIYLVYMSRVALIILASAGFLALALSVPVNKLSHLIPGKSRIGATALAFLLVVAFLSAFLFIVIPPIVEQTGKLVEAVPGIVQSLTERSAGLADFVSKYNLQPQIDAAVANAKDQMSTLVTNLTTGALTQLGSFFATLGALILTLVLTFLMLVEGPEWMKRIWNLYDDEDKMQAHRSVVTRMHKVVSGYVTGQLTVSGIGATASGLAVFILSLIFSQVDAGLAAPAIAISFVLSLIPMFGATLGGTLVTLLLLINSVPAAIAYAIFFIVYQQIENNFISPTIQSKYVELSPLAVLASVTIGLYLFGLAGGIISIPIAGCVKVLIEEYLSHSNKKRAQSKQPIHKLIKKIQGEA